MSELPFDISAAPQHLTKKETRSKPILTRELIFAGHNKDIVEPYHWHLNFAYFVGKGYFFIKLEDHHYFSENSQFGANVRQMKGGSIRALQENLQQLIQLIKVHLLPLLKEVKEADFFRSWMNAIVENDKLYQDGLSKGRSASDDDMKKWAQARDEAINHIKDKWVNEVDGGRIWQMNRSSSEQGLDFALLPQLFFGTTLPNPLYTLHGKGPSLDEQLKDYTYKIDISVDAITAVARFQYRFYTWLPTAIKETQTTFKIKIASLKQFYAQMQMYVNFMKPLLQEIAKKSEGFEKTSAFYNFEEHNPEFWNLLDYSYSFVRVLGVNKFQKEFGSLSSIVMGNYGFYVPGSHIAWGKYSGKNCIVYKQEGSSYKAKLFSGSKEEADKLTKQEFSQLENIVLPKDDLKTYPCVEFAFSQKRRSDVVDTQQGPMQVPYMTNGIVYTGYAWNIFEVASYREFLRQDDLRLLETFVEELGVVKEDLLYYTSMLEGDERYDYSVPQDSSANSSSSKKSSSGDLSFILLPFEGIWDMFSPLLPSFPKRTKKPGYVERHEQAAIKDAHHHALEATKAKAAEDLWKGYTVFKKSHGFIQY